MTKKFADEMGIGERGYLPLGSYTFDKRKGIVDIRLKKNSIVSEVKSDIYNVPVERKDSLKYFVEIKGEKYLVGLGVDHILLPGNVNKKVDEILLKREESYRKGLKKRPVKEPKLGENEILLKSATGDFIFKIRDDELRPFAKISRKGKIHKNFKDI
jgi:hypothetical protein